MQQAAVLAGERAARCLRFQPKTLSQASVETLLSRYDAAAAGCAVRGPGTMRAAPDVDKHWTSQYSTIPTGRAPSNKDLRQHNRCRRGALPSRLGHTAAISSIESMCPSCCTAGLCMPGAAISTTLPLLRGENNAFHPSCWVPLFGDRECYLSWSHRKQHAGVVVFHEKMFQYGSAAGIIEAIDWAKFKTLCCALSVRTVAVQAAACRSGWRCSMQRSPRRPRRTHRACSWRRCAIMR